MLYYQKVAAATGDMRKALGVCRYITSVFDEQWYSLQTIAPLLELVNVGHSIVFGIKGIPNLVDSITNKFRKFSIC